ncbi:MAG: GIY-YIG nuclease family protein [Clostridia bacterium]|nr:GIY-YIG nuclease family protein [Clostridia bacterium]
MRTTEEAFTYIVECRDGSYYCGWTNALWHRMAQHNCGKGARYTGSRRPVHLVYLERWLSRKAAMSREGHIKQMSRDEKKRLIEENRAVMAILDPDRDRSECPTAESAVETFPMPEGFEPMHVPLRDSGILWICENVGGVHLGIAGGFALSGHAVLYGEGESIAYLAPSWNEFMQMPEMYLKNRWLLTGRERVQEGTGRAEMDRKWKADLEKVRKTMKEAEMYRRASLLVQFDLETVCPPDGMEEQGGINAFLETQAFRIRKRPAFIRAVENVYEHAAELPETDRVMITSLHRTYYEEKNLTPEMQHAFALTENRAFIDWQKARSAADFSLFRDSLEEVLKVERQRIELREPEKDAPRLSLYDQMLDRYERGMDCTQLDACFAACRERMIPLLTRIRESRKKIRTDFLYRPVSADAQNQLTEILLGLLDMDRNRLLVSRSEHPFTTDIGGNNVRITTNIHGASFTSNLYTVLHEGGHALFALMDDPEHYAHFITGERTYGMDESVSRFYENRIGRSRSFIRFVYPLLRDLLGDVLADVTEQELYEAVNEVRPSLIRTEADEFTYTFHIMIRYELEKELVDGRLRVRDVPARWAELYREYLGVVPQNDREGCLQDVHWTFGFGYFPTYALGNMYNAMYTRRMCSELDVDAQIESGKLTGINDWMQKHVFARADLENSREWIENIC